MALFAALLACSPLTGPSVEFRTTLPESAQIAAEELSQPTPRTDSGVEEPAVGVSVDAARGPIPAGSAVFEPNTDESNPRLGFIVDREAVAMKNGGRVPLGDDRVAEVFLAPYPPNWQTDLHLYLLNRNDFSPVTDADVDLLYEMVWMDHGIDGQVGRKVADGHYVLPLDFLMYGDWSVDTRITLPEGKKHLRFIVKFAP